MSRIEKLSIQGIRSFGPNDRDKGIIQFFQPLTLILGPNGTGKTTIIECLKYMSTGEIPPGAKVNGAFINDPKIAGEVEVKAQVRLQFYDVQGDPCIAQRSLTATQKKLKVEMKTLEGLIQKRAADGTKVQLSSRCAETDQEMISLLGVSKPILENVIFCHQEDSNWPLSEGRALKQKFDDIFASTRYVKALEVIRKCKMEKNGMIKEYKAELKYLTENKQRVEQVNKSLDELDSRRQVCLDGMQKANKILQPLVEKLDTLESQEENIRQISNTIAKLEGERNQVTKLMENLNGNIKSPFNGSMAELNEEITGFKSKLRKQERELKEGEDKQTNVEGEVREMQRERSKVDREQAVLHKEAEGNSERLENRNKQLLSLTTDYSLSDSLLSSDDVSNRDAQNILKALQKLLTSLDSQLKDKKDEHSREVGRLQREMDGRRDERMRLETEKSLKEKTLKGNTNEVVVIRGKLGRMKQSLERLVCVKEEMAEWETKLASLQSSTDVEEMRTLMNKMQEDRSSHDATIRSLDVELRVLNEDTATRTQLSVYSKEKSAKEANIKRLLARNEDSLKHIMGEVPSVNLKKRLDEYIREQSKRVRLNQDDLSKIRNNLTQLVTTQKIEREVLEKKEKEMRGYETKLGEVTKGEDLLEGLNNLSNKLQAHQDNKGNLIAIDFMFKNYIKKLHREKPDCPLCHRPFDEQSEVEELVTEMENKLSMVPEKLEKLQQAIAESNNSYDSWIQLKPLKESLNACKSVDIPKIEENLQRLAKEVSSLSCKVTEKDEELEADSNDESVAKAMTSDATIVDKLYLDIRDIDHKINMHSSNLKNDTIDKTVEEVEKEKSQHMTKLDSLVAELEGRRAEMQKVTTQLHQHQQRLHHLRTEKMQIEEALRERLQLEEGVKVLEVANVELSQQVTKAEEDLQPILRQIDGLISKKKQCVALFEEDRISQEKKMNSLNSKITQLKRLQDDIDKYERDGVEESLRECVRKLGKLDGRVGDLEEEKEKLTVLVESLRNQLALHKEQERDLEDNRLLMEKGRELGEMEGGMARERAKLGDWDIDNLQKEKNKIKNETESHHKKIEVLRIRKTHADGEVATLKTELNSSSLKNALLKHKEMHIKVKTTEIVCSDLDKYYKALDKSLMSYHVSKMSELNKIIRDLWRSTYKGQDIDTIEIRSDEDDESGGIKVRRLYKYRVVMIRSGVELDMRGRCSAGQKVLASLIIRLALAETFCINCGMLALDEPTTNLDRENIESLAYALTEIIRCRSKQRNFQLIVITHDEDFVELLGRSDYVDDYYRVKKDEFSGNSRVIKTNIQQLQTK